MKCNFPCNCLGQCLKNNALSLKCHEDCTPFELKTEINKNHYNNATDEELIQELLKRGYTITKI